MQDQTLFVCVGSDIYNGTTTGEVSASLTTATGQGAANTGPSVICLQGNIVDRTENSGANGIGARSDDVSYTLNTADRHVVCYPTVFRKATKPHSADEAPRWEQSEVASTINTFDVGENRCNELVVFENHSQDARYTQQGDTEPTCVARWGTGGNNMPLVAEAKTLMGDCVSGTLKARDYKGIGRYDSWGIAVAYPMETEHRKINWIVRRLTPTECGRLQGFPDGWTDIGEWVDEAGKKHKPADNPRYKALGNSIALPQWWWLTCKMAKYLPEHATLGSLFDGIGGFPLVWETYHGKGTAVWASEIEQFPIAVTKKHFPEEEH